MSVKVQQRLLIFLLFKNLHFIAHLFLYVAQDLNIKALIFSTQFIYVFRRILSNVQPFSSNET